MNWDFAMLKLENQLEITAMIWKMEVAISEIRNSLFLNATVVEKLNGERLCVRCRTSGQHLFCILLISFKAIFCLA